MRFDVVYPDGVEQVEAANKTAARRQARDLYGEPIEDIVEAEDPDDLDADELDDDDDDDWDDEE